jgi:transposase-like protein
MILNAIAEKLKRQSKDDFKGRHFEAWLIVQAVTWYLRYPLSYRDLEEMFRERGFEVDHSTVNRWVLVYAPMIEKRLRQFRRPHCGSVRVDETYVKIRGKWRYLYRAIDKHGNPVDVLLTAKRDLDAAKRFFRKMLKDEPLLAPTKIGTDGGNTFPSTIKTSVDDGLLRLDPQHPFPPAQFRRRILQLPIKQAFAYGVRPFLTGLLGCRGSGHGHNPNIRKDDRPDSSRTASKFSRRSNSRVAAQRDRVLPGAEAGTASSLNNLRMTGDAPFVRTFGATASSRAARRSISVATRRAASTAPTSARQIALG